MGKPGILLGVVLAWLQLGQSIEITRVLIRFPKEAHLRLGREPGTDPRAFGGENAAQVAIMHAAVEGAAGGRLRDRDHDAPHYRRGGIMEWVGRSVLHNGAGCHLAAEGLLAGHPA